MVQKFRIIVSNKADKDLSKISKYLSESGMKKMTENLLFKYDNLRQMPHMYQRIYYDEKSKADYRRTVYKNYIITYKIQKNQITILRIVSEKRDYLKSKWFKSL